MNARPDGMGDMERMVEVPGDGPGDDEFLQNLYRGGELLSSGQVAEAKDFLERAHALQPQNQRGQNLLGMAYFKLGIFDRAAEIYEILVHENPADPTLRVNLGLVFLKQNSLPRAIREFEISADLAPDYKKAQNYLGLAYVQEGNYEKARECFIAAGSATMAEKMEKALKDPSRVMAPPPEPRPAPEPPAPERARPPPPPAAIAQGGASTPGPPARPPPPPAAAVRPPPPPVSWPKPQPPASPEKPVQRVTQLMGSANERGRSGTGSADAAWQEVPASRVSLPLRASGAPVPGTGSPAASPIDPEPDMEEQASVSREQAQEMTAPAAVTESAGDAPALEGVPNGEGDPWAAAADRSVAEVPSLSELTRSLARAVAKGPGPFNVTYDAVSVQVRGEIFTRLEGLLASSGAVRLQPEMKRFRGRATDKPYGEGERRIHRATGTGSLLIAPRGRVFVALALLDESAYFQEDLVFGFEEGVIFENGRVPSKVAPDLRLVHLRGSGKVLVSAPATLRAVEVGSEGVCLVPLSVLVGWSGRLSPRIVPVVEEPEALAAVELTGTGFALVANIKPAS
jgi:uncharacterized protein (AIM24 family)